MPGAGCRMPVLCLVVTRTREVDISEVSGPPAPIRHPPGDVALVSVGGAVSTDRSGAILPRHVDPATDPERSVLEVLAPAQANRDKESSAQQSERELGPTE